MCESQRINLVEEDRQKVKFKNSKKTKGCVELVEIGQA